jgi:hypothetical protein
VDSTGDRPRLSEGIEVVPAEDGYVVYDAERDRVHHLNHTAAFVLELCTGENSPDDIGRLLQVAYELSEPPAAETRDCLANLRAEGLVV